MVRAVVLLVLGLLALGACGLDIPGSGAAPVADGGPRGPVRVDDSGPGPVASDAAPFDAGGLPPRQDSVGPDAAPTPTPTPTPVRCDESGAKLVGGHCYFTLPGETNRVLAVTACVVAGAHLVSIGSEAEQRAIETLGEGDRWIGLFAALPPNNDKARFGWDDGTASNYDHWKPGNPDGGFQCVVMDRGDDNQWTDRSCLELHQPFCERE